MRLLGFLFGLFVTLGLEVLLLTAIGASPRGGGWLFIPILSGLSLSRVAPRIWARIGKGEFKRAFFGLQRQTRGLLVGCVLWLVAVPTYVYLFDPFDGYAGSADYERILKIMLFPVGMAIAGYFAYVRLVVADETDALQVNQSEAEQSLSNEVLTTSTPAIAQSERMVEVDEPGQMNVKYCIAAIRNGRPTYGTYDRLMRACGGRIEAKGFLFTAHYQIHLGQKSWTVKRFEDLRPWFLSNLIPRLQTAQQ